MHINGVWFSCSNSALVVRLTILGCIGFSSKLDLQLHAVFTFISIMPKWVHEPIWLFIGSKLYNREYLCYLVLNFTFSYEGYTEESQKTCMLVLAVYKLGFTMRRDSPMTSQDNQQVCPWFGFCLIALPRQPTSLSTTSGLWLLSIPSLHNAYRNRCLIRVIFEVWNGLEKWDWGHFRQPRC